MTALVLSLFPGIGLLDMAFEEEGFCVVRGPDLLWGGDIRRFHPPAGRFDGIIGGPPCQSFSGLANLQRAQGREPAFGDLIPEFERVVAEARPAWFLMENVAMAPVPSVDGYLVHERLVNNRHCGGTQNRVRRFSLGRRPQCDDCLRHFLPFNVIGEALEPAQWDAAVTAAHGGNRKTHFNKATGGRIQRYSLTRACELQGLGADAFASSPFRRDLALKMVANGVPLTLGRAVARAVKRALGMECTT